MVRVPIINFVRVCPTEEAKLVLPQLQAIDSKAAARARSRIRAIKKSLDLFKPAEVHPRLLQMESAAGIVFVGALSATSYRFGTDKSPKRELAYSTFPVRL